VKGKGEHLPPLPSGPFPLPLRAQLVSLGLCLESTFSAADVNTAAKLRAHSD